MDNEESKNPAPQDTENEDSQKVNIAIFFINKRDFASARLILKEVIANIPPDYTAYTETHDTVFAKFWDKEEFFCFVLNPHKPQKDVVWLANAYPRACYYLAYIDIEEGNPHEAMKSLHKAISLEPDHPRLYCEMALLHHRLGEFEKALLLYDKALKLRSIVTPTLKALALRGKGVQLTELGHLELAQSAFLESLDYDPNNRVARNELNYIQHLIEGGEELPCTLTPSRLPPHNDE